MKDYPRDWDYSAGGVADTLPLPRSAGCPPFKAIIEWFIALAALVLLFPVMAIIGFAILVSTGRPIIHKRRVLARDGHEFNAFKFRTMVVDADQMLEADGALKQAYVKQFKLQHDPRVTPLGWWLRRFSLDELPQFLNVLSGRMALVGPRMISREELGRYGRCADRLLSVKPGLTGLWQTSGRQNLTYEQRVALDMHYIDHWSPGLDARIVLRTFRAVLHGRGAF